MPALVVNAGFSTILTNPYELAHKAFWGRPSQDKMAELSRMVVNTDALRFVRFQISIYMPHTLYVWVHHDMVGGEGRGRYLLMRRLSNVASWSGLGVKPKASSRGEDAFQTNWWLQPRSGVSPLTPTCLENANYVKWLLFLVQLLEQR